MMKRTATALKLFALPFALALATSVSTAQGQLGSATVTGSVLVDGQAATGTVAVANAARLSTGDNASVALHLASGGDVMLAGQADVIVTSTPAGPRLQIVCGEVTVSSTVPATVVATNGLRVMAKTGHVMVTDVGKGNKSTTLKESKAKDFGNNVTVAMDGANSAAVITSQSKCNCNCP
jgi:hypothetical protein